MKRNVKYSLVLSATLALSFCQGNRSRITDPFNGQNSMTTAQYMEMANQPTQAVNDSTRALRYSLNYTNEQATACVNAAGLAAENGTIEPGEITSICNQIINDHLSKTMGVNYTTYAPDGIEITAPNGKKFMYIPSQQLSSSNAPWLGQYQNYIGGTNPQASGFYHTPLNMQQFCGNPSTVTTMAYSNPCGQYNWTQGTIAVNSNNGLNYMRQGDYTRAAGVFGPGGYMQLRAPKLYGTVLSRRNVGKENAELNKQVEASWTNMKQLPKNWGLRLLNRAMDVPAAMGENIVSGVERNLSGMSANQYMQAGYNQQMTAQNDMIANQYYAAVEMSQYNTLAALQPDTPCPQDKFYYQIGTEPATNSSYKVIECDY